MGPKLGGPYPGLRFSMALTDQLVSYWKLEEASGPRADAAGTNTLSDVNTVINAVGVIGDAAHFVKVNNEALSIASNATFLVSAMTFSMWVKLTSSATTNGLLSKDDGGAQRQCFIDVLAAGTLEIGIWNQAAAFSGILTSGTAITTGTYFFIVGKWDGATLSIIVNNGTPDTVGFVGATLFNSTSPFELGRGQTDSSRCLNGDLDEVGFWSRALTPAEITELYNAGAGLSYPFAAGGDGIRSSMSTGF